LGFAHQIRVKTYVGRSVYRNHEFEIPDRIVLEAPTGNVTFDFHLSGPSGHGKTKGQHDSRHKGYFCFSTAH